MISPTGKGIRVDPEGDGNYGAPRGDRVHRGVDYLCDPGQIIVAPFDMFIDRVSFPNSDKKMEGIAWTKGKSTGRMWYFMPFKELLGTQAYKGKFIGRAQSVSAHYGLPKMRDHIHFQVNR